MVADVFLLVLGMVLLVKGADLFVSGASRIAKALKIPSLVIGLTLVSMGTSAPEASVSIIGAINGLSELSIGNIVGSNIFNTLFILGVSSLIIPLSVSRDIKYFDIPVLLGIYGILIVFGFAISPLKLDIVESVVLLLMFVAYTALLFVRAVKSKNRTPLNAELMNGAIFEPYACTNERECEDLRKVQEPETDVKEAKRKRRIPLWLSVIFAALGLAGIIIGGDLVVDKASKIAQALGMSEILVGLTIVAVGTSLPELVTSVVASVKKENDIAIGNVIGSNIFNIVFILGVSSCINNLTLTAEALTDMLVMLGSGVLLCAFALCSKKINRLQGLVFVLLYVGYLAYVIVRN